MDTTLRMVITVLCGVGLYASIFMLAKARRAERGELTEPSVVQTPRARLFGGIPNAAFGVVYYPALAVGIWAASTPHEIGALLLLAAIAAGTSIRLAYSLLYVTRMPCVYCWTSHVVNWSLVLLLSFALFKLSYWQ